MTKWFCRSKDPSKPFDHICIGDDPGLKETLQDNDYLCEPVDDCPPEMSELAADAEDAAGAHAKYVCRKAEYPDIRTDIAEVKTAAEAAGYICTSD
jgi:hypothetical protein